MVSPCGLFPFLAHPSDPYRLDVIVPGELNFYLRAGSPHERQEWLVALGSVKSCINTEKASKGKTTDSSLLRVICKAIVIFRHSRRGDATEKALRASPLLRPTRAASPFDKVLGCQQSHSGCEGTLNGRR